MAVSRKINICAAPVLKSMLRTKWKGAKFVFNEGTNSTGKYDIADAVTKVVNKTCDALLVEEWVIKSDENLFQIFCDAGLMTNGVKALDLNIAFPVKEKYVAGVSHYMKKLEQSGVFFLDLLKKDYKDPICKISEDPEVTTDDQMTIRHMAVPIIVLAICIIISCFLKLISKNKPAVFQAFDKTLDQEADTEDSQDDRFHANPESSLWKSKSGATAETPEGAPNEDNPPNRMEKFQTNLFDISKDVMKLSHDMKYKKGPE
uniref:Uncharacterized protein n=1 Tax=Eucampia antarctica TaxID=49252 RepID=A0A7S2RRT6_9STRA